ncbi:MAG: DUF1080 domain-containing protein [Acidobacteriota bacterium]|nr:MAG: DUF1080 domain-containing protein [Acidobacteriota bacterium]
MKGVASAVFLLLLSWGCGSVEVPTQSEGEPAPALTEEAAPAWIDLTAAGLADWQEETGEWLVAGDAALRSDDEKLLAPKEGEGVLINGPNGITVDLLSRKEHGDIEAHVEFLVARGSNSGVYFQSRYEVQVFDSWEVEEPTFSDCGGIYQRWIEESQEGYEGHPPRVNASRPPGEWQTFDVVFRAPRFDESGQKVENARFVKVVHNGAVVHEDVELTGPTRASTFEDEKALGPLMVQGDHGPVAYRNIRIRMLE